MDKDFSTIEIDLRKGFIISEPDIAYFSEDNSFPEFLKIMMNKMLGNIAEAINDSEISKYENVSNDLRRFFSTMFNSFELKIFDHKTLNFFENFSLLIKNWLDMVSQGDLESFFQLKKEEMEGFKKAILEISDLMTLNLDVQNLHFMCNNLMKKAEMILAATPSNFKISDHFFNALKRENNGIDK